MIVRLLIVAAAVLVVGAGLRALGIEFPWDLAVSIPFGVLAGYFVVPRSPEPRE